MPPRRPPRPTAFSTAAAVADIGDLTAYERERAANIARNQALLKQLAVADAVAALAPPPRAPAARRGVKRTKRPAADAPRRASARLAGQASDGAHVVEEMKGGRVIAAGVGATEPAPPRERHPAGDVPFASANGGDDAGWLADLKAGVAASGGGGGKRAAAATTPPPLASVARAALAPGDVCKVTAAAAVHLAFHPTFDAASKLLLAVADKRGGVSLWDAGVSARASEDADADAAAPDGGVLAFAPHNQYVSGLKWAAGTGVLYTCSYDGSIRALDPAGDGAFRPALLDGDAEWSAFDATDDGRVALVADKDGDAVLFDPRTGARAASLALADRKVNTVAFAPGAGAGGSGDARVATSSADGAVRVFDLRALRPAPGAKASGAARRPVKAVAEGQHAATCQSAYWAPDGSGRLVTTSRDDTIAVWSPGAGAALTRTAVCPHNNNTGRWIVPFRAVWTAGGDGILCGGMRRTVDVFDAAKGGKPRAALADEAQTAIASRLAVHPTAGALAAATGSGRVSVWRY